MTFFELTRKNTWRKPLRTILLMICVAVAFLIYGLLASFVAGSQGSSAARDEVLGVSSTAGMTHPLPLAYLSRIAAQSDVAAVGYMTRLRGFVEVEKNVVSISATDPQTMMAVSGPELGLTSALIDAIDGARDRILVGRALADANEWAIGDRITVTAFEIAQQGGSRNWRFEIAGIFEGQSASTDTYFAIARYDYVNANRATARDTVNAFVLLPSDGVSPAEVAARIDALFANSAAPTRTQSEKQFLEAFMRQYADIGMIVSLVTGAAFVTLLMIIINTMFFAVRERRFEIGVLKTLGFSRLRIMTLVLAETLLIFVVGGSIGLALAKLATIFSGAALGLALTPLVIAKACAAILILGIATGALPAISAMRTAIVSAFRTR
ncbi:MAG: ABC transporter permease [Sulfitobacter sp.]